MKLTAYQKALRATKKRFRGHEYLSYSGNFLTARRAIKLHTVNVIEITGGTGDMDVQGVHSFADTPDGNKQAEKLFLRCIKENSSVYGNGIAKDDKTDLLDDGYFIEGDYHIMLTHSV